MITNFFTEVKLPNFPFSKLNQKSVITGIGSCFAEKFLEKFANANLQCTYNPSGIIYNLHSINEIIEMVVNDKIFCAKDFHQVNNRYVLLSHHGCFGSENLDYAIKFANDEISKFRKQLKNSDCFILTPSSSVVYRYKKTCSIVGNCHKISNNEFDSEILSQQQNYFLLQKIIDNINVFNPDCKIILSLSPIRHYPGNLLLNSRSKSNLLSAIYDICERYNEQVCYFAAYEIIHDELRDYRFFGEDMLHLTNFAESLILQRFINWASTKELIDYLEEAEKIKKLENHRKIN